MNPTPPQTPDATARAGRSDVTPDSQLIRRITYLASLASARDDVRPKLDALHAITAAAAPGTPLSENDRSKLRQLEDNLKHYLIYEDPLRSFTPQSLEKQIENHEQPLRGTGVNHRQHFLVVIAASVVGAAVPLLFLDTLGSLALSVPLFFSIMAVGTAWFYLTALIHFKQELLRVFVWLCAGALLLAASFSQYALILVFGLDEYPVFKYGGITWILTLALLCFYAGLRAYARLLRVAPRARSWPPLVAALAAAVLIALAVPYPATVEEPGFFRFSLAGEIMIAVFAAYAALLAYAIKRNVTSAYAISMRWLFLYLTLAAVAAAGGSAAFLTVGALSGTTLALATFLLGVGPQLLMLYTGYSFKKETDG